MADIVPESNAMLKPRRRLLHKRVRIATSWLCKLHSTTVKTPPSQYFNVFELFA